MKSFFEGELVRYRGRVVGNVVGLFNSEDYPNVYTVLQLEDNDGVCWWRWENWTLPRTTNPKLRALCRGKRVYNFHIDELQKAQTKLGNTL